MIIAISGFTGCGKNTLGELLAKKLGYKLVCPTFKDLAAKEGVSLMEFQEKAANDPNIDKKFDKLLREQANGNCVVTTWLGPWIVDADVRIRLFVKEDIRAERVAKRDGISVKKALTHIKKRDKQNIMRYKKIYNIDIRETDNFDACFNSGKYNPEELVNLCMPLIKKFGN